MACLDAAMLDRPGRPLLPQFGALAVWLSAACSGSLGQPSGPAGPGDGTDLHPDAGADPDRDTDVRLPMLRLTRAELDLALADSLGDDSNPAQRLLSEEPFTPFDRDVAGQEPSAALVDGLQALAEDVTARLLADPARFQLHVGCALDAGSAEACFDAFVARLVPLLLRHPITAEEAQTYRALWELSGQAPAELGPRIGVAASLVIESIIQQPEFLYRVEHGDGAAAAQETFALSPFEVATRLAFWVWGRPPDAALLAEAAAGRLATGADRRREATRLYADARAREHWRRYHAMWLGYRAIPHDPALVAAFRAETDALIDRTLFEANRSYFELFTSQETYLSASLAEHYGLPAPNGESDWVAYPADSSRQGLLSHGSVLSAFSKFSDTSPTQRGIFVRDRLMCWPVDPPPPVVDVDQPPQGASPDACKAERYRAHGEASGCAGCHGQIDPIGFGLERFDMAGRTREHDDGAPDCPIEGSGVLPGHGSFEGPAELAELLLDSGELTDCSPRFVLQYLWGRQLGAEDDATVDAMGASFADVEYRFGAWLIAMVEDPRFVRRKQEEAP